MTRLGGVLVKRTQIGEEVKLTPERDDAAKQPLATVAVRQVAGGLPARDSGPERILTMLATGVQQPMTLQRLCEVFIKRLVARRTRRRAESAS